MKRLLAKIKLAVCFKIIHEVNRYAYWNMIQQDKAKRIKAVLLRIIFTDALPDLGYHITSNQLSIIERLNRI